MGARRTAALMATIVAAAMATGCGGGDADTSAVAAKTATAAAQSEGWAMQMSTGVPQGHAPVMVNEGGETLYSFGADEKGTSAPACTGRCAETFRPQLTEAQPKVLPGRELVRASLLGRVERADGTTQVTYGGYPLYHYFKETTGRITAVGRKAFGATWYAVLPNGERVSR